MRVRGPQGGHQWTTPDDAGRAGPVRRDGKIAIWPNLRRRAGAAIDELAPSAPEAVGGCDSGARSRRRSWLPPGPQPRRRQVIVLGMTRSGTSLTTAIVADSGGSTRPAATCGEAVLAQRTSARLPPATSGRCAPRTVRCPLPRTPQAAHSTHACPGCGLAQLLGAQGAGSWTKFSAGFASRPTLLAWGAKNERQSAAVSSSGFLS